MSGILSKSMLKMVKGMIGPEAIQQAIKGVQEMAAAYVGAVSINKEAGEAAAAVFYQVNEIWFFAVLVIDQDNKIKSFERVQPLEDFIQSLIKQI